MMGRSGSLAATASHLNVWHGCATCILHYPVSGSIPPRCEEYVVDYASTVFRNGDIAQNYIGTLTWVCCFSGTSPAWSGMTLRRVIESLKKSTFEEKALELQYICVNGGHGPAAFGVCKRNWELESVSAPGCGVELLDASPVRTFLLAGDDRF